MTWNLCAHAYSQASLAIILEISLLVSSIGNSACAQQINSIIESKDLPISVSASGAARWKQGSYDVWHLKEQVVIAQGNTTITAHQAIAWYEKADLHKKIPGKIIVYAEGHRTQDPAKMNSTQAPQQNVIVETLRTGDPHRVTGQASDQQESSVWLGRFYSNFGVQFNTPIMGPPPGEVPDIFQRGLEARQQETRQAEVILAQFQQPLQVPFVPPQNNFRPVPQSNTTPTKIDFKPRSKNPLNVRAFPSADQSENIVLYTGGVRVTFEGQQVQQLQTQLDRSGGSSERFTIEADTVVAWTNPIRQLVENNLDDSAKRWEIYLEGNIVFSTDDRVVYADRMYYDVQLKRGTILKAEMYSRIPGYEGMLRLKADVLEQIDQNNARAYGGAITSSRIGVPRYWLQSEVVNLNRRPRLDFNEFGQIEYDPQTGQPKTEWTYDGTSRNNFLYVLGTPVLFWPTLNGNIDQSSYYISGLAIKNDNVFGMQTYTKWNGYQLFGVRRPPDNTNWDLNLDYLSDRGLGLGSEGDYDLKDPYGFRTLNKGQFEAWGIFDDGLDNVGRGRRTLIPEQNFRGRVFWQHRTRFANGLEWIGETGIVSDRNFLEQYREREWDREKDHVNRLQVKKLHGDQSLNVSASYRTSDFFTQTSRLPSFNYFLLGRSLWNNRLSWSMHAHVGYHDLDIADAPIDPTDAARFDPLAWEVPSDGVIAGIRNEISLPLQTGAVRTTPYFISESTFYGEDALGNQNDRFFGQGGLRFSLPMVKVNPQVQDVLLNINGLAHKIEWEADIFFAEATDELAEFPLYHALDDDAQEHFRRRFLFNSFGGTFGDDVPIRFEERNFAFRNGIQSNVTGSPEIVDDLFAARLGVNQRWQTKRGPGENQKIIDWIVFNFHGTFFPKANRDNHGESIGVFDYDFRWHIGDRLTILSDGYADAFSQGLKTISIGARLTRPEVGNVFVGFRSIEGPISANVLNAQINQRLTDKWAMSFGTSMDFAASGNLGQRFAISRIGESAIVRAGFNVDVSRGTTGLNFVVLPRFVPKKTLRQSIGVEIPHLGAQGIE